MTALPAAADQASRLIAAAVASASAGDLQGALHAASEACYTAPELAQAHYAYGEALMRLNDPAQAEQAFAACIQRAPAWPDAWINLGLARYRQGAIGDAIMAMRRALQHAPAHPAALANLGAFLRIAGATEEAERLMLAALAHQPDNAGVRLNLAADMLQEERPAAALALLDEAPALPAEPRIRRHWHLQRSLALINLGRPAEARAALAVIADLGPVPPEIAPLWHWRHVLLAVGEGELDKARDAAEQMRSALASMGAEGVPEHRIMAHYDLAKFWSSLGEHGIAFEQWRAAHDLLKPTQPFSRDAHAAVIDAQIAAFTAESFATRQGGNTDPAPVFIVGMPRSGTTLCEQIIAAHAHAHGAGERLALGNAFAALGGGTDAAAAHRIANLDAASFPAVAEAYLADLHGLAPSASRIVDKMPANYLYLGLVGRMLPGAKIIHCIRDPRDIGLSIYTFRFHGSHGYAHDLADLGWTIAQQERLMDHWRAVLPNAILTVSLSDWVNAFDATLARVLTHLGLPPDPACIRFYKGAGRVRTVSRSQVRQPVNASGLGRWRSYAEELKPLIAELEHAGVLSRWTETGILKSHT